MKTVTRIFLVLILFTNVVFAQHEVNLTGLPKINIPPSKVTIGPNSFKNPNTLRGISSNWVNYANDYATFLGNGTLMGPYFSNSLLLFPDTGIILELYHDTLYYPQLHSAAVMYDPYHSPLPWLTSGSSYTCDSVAVEFAYTRNLGSNIVDTLQLTMLQSPGTPAGNLTITSTKTNATIFVCPAVKYDYKPNSPDPVSSYSTQKIPLTEVDSTSHFQLISYPVTGVPVYLPPPSLVGAAVTFIPGYTYSINDSIDQKDQFYLLSSEENGVGTNMTWITGDLNSSYIIPSFTRYNTDPGWNGLYFPTFAEDYGDAAWPYENHIIWFHLVTNNLGIKDLLVSNSLDFYPNPTKDIANLSYNLSQDAKQVTFKVTDVTGREMYTQVIGEQPQGSHEITFSTKNLASGVYVYSFSVDNVLYNGKFVIE